MRRVAKIAVEPVPSPTRHARPHELNGTLCSLSFVLRTKSVSALKDTVLIRIVAAAFSPIFFRNVGLNRFRWSIEIIRKKGDVNKVKTVFHGEICRISLNIAFNRQADGDVVWTDFGK
jgi:hypothetical protein